MKEELIYKISELAVMIVSILIARYVIPWLKQKTDDDRIQQFIGWVEYAVLWAEQVYTDSTGAERKQHVIEFLEDLAQKIGIGTDILTEEQLDMLIEAAVRTMNIEMGKYDPTVRTMNIEMGKYDPVE